MAVRVGQADHDARAVQIDGAGRVDVAVEADDLAARNGDRVLVALRREHIGVREQ